MESPKISIREARISDLDLVFYWANDALVRAQSFNAEAVNYESHIDWFQKKITSQTDLILIATVDGLPAGLVRIDDVNQKNVVGILVDAKFRGRGLASLFLDEAITYYFQKFANPVFAYIKKTNTASVKTFEKAGFMFLQEDQISGYPSFVYILKGKSNK